MYVMYFPTLRIFCKGRNASISYKSYMLIFEKDEKHVEKREWDRKCEYFFIVEKMMRNIHGGKK